MATNTSFCCRSGGSNLNAGTATGDTTEPGTSPLVTYTGGDWVAATDIYTAPVGADMTEAVVGRWAALYHDGDTSPTTNQYLIARITAVNSGTRQITLSTTARGLLGTEVADGTGNRSLRIGGAWAGPSGSNWFPLTLGTINNWTNAAGDPVRINLKNDQTYSMTAAHSAGSNYVELAGYSSSYGDSGRATINSGTNAIDVLTVTGVSFWIIRNLIGVSTYSGTSVNRFLVIGGNGSLVENCVASGFRWEGLSGTANAVFVECEAYGNGAGQAGRGGVFGNAKMTCVRCDSHDNTGPGFVSAGGAFIACIADSNTVDGVLHSSDNDVVISGCDFYNNGSDGIEFSGAFTKCPIHVENCNFVKNGGYGVRGAAAARRGFLLNCGFGAGTQANTSGAKSNTDSFYESGTVTYANDVTPWTDPANGDFRVSLAAAKGVGRGTFTQTASSYTGAVGYPDIGACQHADSASGGLRVHPGMVGGMTG